MKGQGQVSLAIPPELHYSPNLVSRRTGEVIDHLAFEDDYEVVGGVACPNATGNE